PAGKYLGTLAKTGKTAGLTAVKTSIKTAVKEGIEQGAKNFDTFKGLLKNVKGMGDNIYHSLSTYRKQLARHLQNTVDEGLLNLSRATQEGLERAKQFTLEVPTVVVRETSTGSQMMRFEKMSKSLGDTGLGKSLDNLASKAKHVENTRLDRLRARNAFYGNKVDDVLEAGSKVGKDIDGKIFGRLELANKSHPKTGIKFDQEGFPIFDSFGDMYLEPEDYLKSRGTHFDRASKDLYQQIMANDELARRFTQEEIELFKKGSVPKRFTWHHHQKPGLMQLVDRRIHRQTGHIGGYSIWGKGN
ncbi:HNH endonuclease, partial [Streptococcus oralis]